MKQNSEPWSSVCWKGFPPKKERKRKKLQESRLYLPQAIDFCCSRSKRIEPYKLHFSVALNGMRKLGKKKLNLWELEFNAILAAMVIVVSDTPIQFPGFLTLSTDTTFFPKPLITFLTCIRDARQKFASKKVSCYQVSNSQPPGNESESHLLS